MENKESEPLTVDEVAQVLRVSRPVILRMLGSGSLKGRKVGRTWRILRSAIDDYLDSTEPQAKKGRK